jgi:phosphoenolpyruvate synthase/pyruvate phosphate dikinase
MFTVNPINNSRNDILINSSFGLGEAIVSGIVNCDVFVYDKREVLIRNKKLVEKTIKIIMNDERNGVKTIKIDEKEEQLKQSISDNLILKLSKIGKKFFFILIGENIESYFKYPQDIEFGIYKDEIYILQARPITKLIPKGLFIHNINLNNSLKNLYPSIKDEYSRVYSSMGHQQMYLGKKKKFY